MVRATPRNQHPGGCQGGRRADQGSWYSPRAQRSAGQRGALRPDRHAEPARRLRSQPWSAGQATGALANGTLGQLEEAAATIAFLASEEAGFITAAALPLDGGITEAFTLPE